MVAYRYDPEHIAPANAAPRCQYIRVNGRRCGAPARRRRCYCHFHEHVTICTNASYKVRFIEDATTLQFALVEVMRLLDSPRPDYKACGLKLYALQIACSNMKALRAEQAEVQSELQSAEVETESAEPVDTENDAADAMPVADQNDGADAQAEEPRNMAEVLLGLLHKPDNGAASRSVDASAPAADTPPKFPPGRAIPATEAAGSRAAYSSQPSSPASCRIETSTKTP